MLTLESRSLKLAVSGDSIDSQLQAGVTTSHSAELVLPPLPLAAPPDDDPPPLPLAPPPVPDPEPPVPDPLPPLPSPSQTHASNVPLEPHSCAPESPLAQVQAFDCPGVQDDPAGALEQPSARAVRAELTKAKAEKEREKRTAAILSLSGSAVKEVVM